MPIEYQLIRSRRRTLELRLYPDRRIEVRAPLRATRAEIEAFVASRHEWLRTRLARLERRPVVPDSERYAAGSRHWYLGEQLVLDIRRGPAALRREQDRLVLLEESEPDHERVRARLDAWYLVEAKADFAERLARLHPFFAARGHALPRLRIRAMRSRWGSLSSSGWMSLNLELIKTPPDCIDYVITHELCHLEHMNHGPGFRALLTERMPDWRERRQRLRRHPL